MSVEQSQSSRPIYEPTFTPKDCWDSISTIVLPILLTVSLSLSIYYAVHPVSMVHITGNVSISLPLMICGSASVALTIMFTVQLVRHKEVGEAYENLITNIVGSSNYSKGGVRTALHPRGKQNGQTSTDHIENKSDQIKRMQENHGCNSITIQTQDGVTLGAYWSPSNNHKTAPTAILFHGNGMYAEDMITQLAVYKYLVFNVLIPEFRGYGISGGEAAGPNQEMGAYMDAEAALKFVLDKGVDREKILTHGISLGGAYAAALGYFFNVKHLVLNHTFTKFSAVASHVVPVPETLVGKVIDVSYEQSQKDSSIQGAKTLVTDGFNSLSKIQKLPANSEIFVIRGETDHLMPLNFGEAFVQAKYPNDPVKQKARLSTMPGGHGNFANFFELPECRQQFYEFLQERELVSEEQTTALENWYKANRQA